MLIDSVKARLRGFGPGLSRFGKPKAPKDSDAMINDAGKHDVNGGTCRYGNSKIRP